MILDEHVNKRILESKKEISGAIIDHIVNSEIHKRIDLIKSALSYKLLLENEMRLSRGNKQKALEEKINTLNRLVDEALDKNTLQFYKELDEFINKK